MNRDGTFELKGEGDGKVLYLDLRNRGENIYFYAGAGTYELENRDGFLYVVPKDSNIYQSRVVVQTQKMDENMQAMQELQKALSETQDQTEKEGINERIGELFDKDNELAFETIRKFAGTSLATVFVRDNIWKLKYEFKNFEQAVGLMESVLVSDVEKQVMKKYQEEKAKQLTGKAPDFKLPDTKGNIVKLSDYKGKYLLVDFWASWCKPCREKAKELKKHYPRLKELGVEVVGISCDKNKDQWLKAIGEDQPLWVQVVIDKEINGSDTADDYKVEFIPTLYLISPEGMILEKNPSVEDVEVILNNL